ncbi:MAG: hypothetical protein KDC38_10645 [Planctomycetes bacterium]|nr:hypothetical protein [Planctomycetota bacterium]
MHRTRILAIAMLFLLAAGAIAGRLVWMQGLHWRDYRTEAERVRRSTTFFSAPRGRILDRNGQVLSEDAPSHAVIYTLRGVVQSRWVARRVLRLFRHHGIEGSFPYDEDRLFESLEAIRQFHGPRLGSDERLDPHLWIHRLTPDQARQLDAALENPKRAPYYPGLELAEDGSVLVRPKELFAGEAGIRRLQRRIEELDPERPSLDLYRSVETAYGEMRDPVEGLKRQLDDVVARLRVLEVDQLDPQSPKLSVAERVDLRERLWTRRDWLKRKIDDPGYHSTIRQRLFEKERVLVDGIPFELVAEIAEHPEAFPGLSVREVRSRVNRTGPVLANLIGRVSGRTAEVDLEWRERGEPIVDSWYPEHGRLKSIRDPRTFLAVREVAHHSEDLVGASGLEKFLESRLRGRPGARNLEVDAQGRSASAPIWNEPPQPGEDVSLTLDTELCRLIYARLDAREPRPFGASVLVGDPRTGAIDAWISYPAPDFDRLHHDDEYRGYVDDHAAWLNRPIQARVEPGSTFKLAVAVAALAEGVLDPSDTIECRGAYDLRKPNQLRCRNHAIPMSLDLRGAVARSCNCYFYTVAADRLGAEKIGEWGRRLHFWDHIGNGMDGSRTWGDPPRARGRRPLLGIGRTFDVRPVGVFRFLCGVANRGDFVSLRLVADDEERHEDAGVPAAVWESVIAGMEGAVEFGTASSDTIGLRRFDCAVKTGTAESRWREVAPSGESELIIGNTAWLVGFAPVEEPQVAFMVNVERTPDGQHGGETCGALAAAVLDWYEEHRQLDLRRRPREDRAR